MLGLGGCLVAFLLSLRDIGSLFGGERTNLFLFLVQVVCASVAQCMACCAKFRVGRVWSYPLKPQFCSWMNLVFESIRAGPSGGCTVVARLWGWGCLIVSTVVFCAKVCCSSLLVLWPHRDMQQHSSSSVK